MQRTNVVELITKKYQNKMLLEMMILSSCVWNIANYNFRQAVFKKEKVKSFFQQVKSIQSSKEYQKLGRCYSQSMLHKHSFIVNAFFGLIKSKNKKRVGLPKYYKNRKTNTTLPSMLITDAERYYIKNDKVFLPLSRQMRKETKLKGIVLQYKGKPRWEGKQGQAEIHYNKINKKFYLHQSVEVKDPKPKIGNKALAIDIGIKRGITSFNGKKAWLYPNPIIKKWKKITAKIKRLQKIAKTRNNQWTTKQITALYAKRKKMVDNYYKNIASWAIADAKPSKVIVGNVKNILAKPQKNRKANQMTHNLWSFDLLYKRLQNKCEEKGIQFERVDERGTTQLCPVCGHKNKPHDRDYSCSCGYSQDRDVNGAINIFKQNVRENVCLHPVVENHRLLVGGFG